MTTPAQIERLITWPDVVMTMPMLLLSVVGLGVLLFDLILKPAYKWLNSVVAIAGLGAATASVIYLHRLLLAAEMRPNPVTGFSAFANTLVIDRLAIYFFYLFIAGAAISVVGSVSYLRLEHEDHGEFYALVLFAVVGMMCMACGNDLVMLYTGLELMAITTYVMVGFLRGDKRSNEAALKYMLLGAFSSGVFAYGLSLFYGLTGSTKLDVIAAGLQARLATNPRSAIVVFGLITTCVGLLFKIAAVPFHQWAPDAYEGAPTNVTGFMSVAVKAAGWALLLRLFLYALYPLRALYLPMITFVAVASLIGGNLAAMTQTNVKRLLAYSSISHVGFMLLGVVASDGKLHMTGIKGVLVYLLVYTFMNLGAFTVITSLRRREIIGDEIEDLNGLYKEAPVEAVLMLVFLLSLAGIPPLAGFLGKYFIFLALIETGHYTLAAVAVGFAVIAMYYYLRLANAMFMHESRTDSPVVASWGVRSALFVTAFATIAIGLFPNVFIKAVDWSLSGVKVNSVSWLR